MYYKSTRSETSEKVNASYAIKQGLCPDGGLYMPSEIPVLTDEEIKSLLKKPYYERSAFILSKFLNDYTYEELLEDAKAAYSFASFPDGAAPIKKIDNKTAVLELWHGPTCAFKDMALQIMPRLLSRALVKNGEKRTALILVATSGDTGKAALEGYKDIKGVKIIVFYPENGVSRVQKLQMQTQSGDNVCVKAIFGNFDDAQTGVKRIFSDEKMRKELDNCNVFLSSANSINWGRLAPQIAYYVSAYLDCVNNSMIKYGEKLNFCVPTGNFGNIFAALIAKKMGLPIGKLICASNENNVLTQFFDEGIYDKNRSFHTTLSPSMDILVSSNLERLIYLTCGAEKTKEYMEKLAKDGKYALPSDMIAEIRKDFCGFFTSEEETKNQIKNIFEEKKYLIDTHTAVAYSALEKYRKINKGEKTVLVSTASPYKFAYDVFASLTGTNPSGALEALDELSSITKTEIPAPLADTAKRKVRFTSTIKREEMENSVTEFAKKG